MSRLRLRIVSAVFGVASVLLAAVTATAASWTGAPGPLDGAHVVIVRGSSLKTSDAQSAALVKDPQAADGQAAEVSGPLAAKLTIKHAGKYVLWVRASVAPKLRSPLAVSLFDADGKPLATSNINDGSGQPGVGGPAAYEAYAKLARQTGAEGRAEQAVAGGGDRKKDLLGGDDLEKELLAELDARKGVKRAKIWTTSDRLEEQKGNRPWHWWNVGTAELKPGAYSLAIAPAPTTGKTGSALVDIAFLTTSTEVAYPWLGDVDAPKASYVRFRIDRLPEGGATISAGMRVHYEPWSVGPAWLNPSKLSETKSEPHVQTGFTRWYRLQDIERAPPFGAVEAHLSVNVVPVKPGVKAGSEKDAPQGATQFAVVPHEDFVLREIGWDEPEGTNVSLLTDFETHLHRLRTLRDHAREDYDKAVAATQGKVFPLTRGPLYFGNAWGAASGDALDYMAKTLRLLGFNSVGQANDALAYRKLYGWTSHAGEYWPPVHMPFDEAKSVKAYDDYYSSFFSKQREFYEGVSIFQLADEPGEISRAEMTAPFWRFVKDAKSESGGRWVDSAGDSELATNRVDLGDCVLEGKVEQHGTWIGFRVATDKPANPARYAYWHLGAVSQNREINVAAGKLSGKPGAAPSVGQVTRPAAVVGREPTEFKIVYEGNSAALFIRGKLVHQHTDLPAKGGFAIVGPVKAVAALKFRAIGKDEHLTSGTLDSTVAAKKPKDDLLDDLDELSGSTKKLPDWAKPKPLEQFVREDWTFGGGMPDAHAAFRTWAQKQGLKPDLFGQKTWDDVRMLTVAELVETPADARLFYWSRRFSGWLTPKMFALSADAIRRHAPNPEMQNFVALSGHALYFPSQMPLDMFQLAAESPAMMPGVSDWMSYGSWRWDCHQAVAFSVAAYNAGARRHGAKPATFPMMHCVWPSDFRSYTMLANQVKYVSFYNFGPSYAVTEGHWNDADGSYVAVHNTANRAAQVDDVLATATARPSRVAMLYSIANEYWSPQSSFADKRALFLGLSHDYYQPELITEDQVAAGDLKHYDALYVLEPIVATAAQEKMAAWVNDGGLMVASADALRCNEFNEPRDLLRELSGVEREFAPEPKPGEPKPAAAPSWPGPRFSPVKGLSEFRPHAVVNTGMPRAIRASANASVRATYDDGRPAWIEAAAGKGRVAYFGHRLGLTYTTHALRRGGHPTVWADTGRAPFVAPLKERNVERELVLSHPLVMAAPMTNENGTVVILHNMHPVALKDVEVALKEPTKPAVVQCFEGDALRDVPFEWRDGRVTCTLPELHGPQMVIVRTKPAPTDDRIEVMLKRTREQLASTDWRALSSGAFFAGSHPEWKLASSVAPLLKHEKWEVRRAAAEAVGRIGDERFVAPLARALDEETDAHVLGDGIVALAKLGDPMALDRCRTLAAHRDAFVRSRAHAAATEILTATATASPSPKTREDVAKQAGELAGPAHADADLRVRSTAIRLTAACNPDDLLARALIVFDPTTADPLAQPTWGEALAASPHVLETWLKKLPPENDALFHAVASRVRHPELSRRLLAQVGRLSNETAAPFLQSAMRQRDPAVARALFEVRKSLPPQVAASLPILLEYTFDARLGEPLEDWDAFLRQTASAAIE